MAEESFPLTKEQAIEKGYSWKDPEKRQLTITMTNDQLPDHIKEILLIKLLNASTKANVMSSALMPSKSSNLN